MGLGPMVNKEANRMPANECLLRASDGVAHVLCPTSRTLGRGPWGGHFLCGPITSIVSVGPANGLKGLVDRWASKSLAAFEGHSESRFDPRSKPGQSGSQPTSLLAFSTPWALRSKRYSRSSTPTRQTCQTLESRGGNHSQRKTVRRGVLAPASPISFAGGFPDHLPNLGFAPNGKGRGEVAPKGVPAGFSRPQTRRFSQSVGEWNKPVRSSSM